jgi:hypothetical protein
MSQTQQEQTHEQQIQNEGFMNIITDAKTTFVQGAIYDMENNLVCPGEIIHEFIDPDDEDAAADAASDVTHKTPLLHGLPVRFYWTFCNDVWRLLMSTVDEIYPQEFKETIPPHILSQIDTEQLAKDKVYYAVLESPPPAAAAKLNGYGGRVMLTYITPVQAPVLSCDRTAVQNDMAFQHHQVYKPVELGTTLKSDPADVYGTLFLCADGRIIEKRSLLYQNMQAMAKPSNMSFRTYFLKALNTYPVGDSFTEYLDSLFCDIHLFTEYFPAYKTAAVNLMAEHTILLRSNL